MIKFENTPVRARSVMSKEYTEAGQSDFKFLIPQPFTAEHFKNVAEIGASPQGLANQANQVLCENLCNNIAARARIAIKQGLPLPTQEDMDALYAVYDFSGLRQRGTGTATSLFDRIFARLAGGFIRKLIKAKGYKELRAPVTVAKKDTTPGPNQISIEAFEAEVERLVDGEGPWSEVDAFIEVRNGLIEEAEQEEANIRAREGKAEGILKDLGL